MLSSVVFSFFSFVWRSSCFAAPATRAFFTMSGVRMTADGMSASVASSLGNSRPAQSSGTAAPSSAFGGDTNGISTFTLSVSQGMSFNFSDNSLFSLQSVVLLSSCLSL